MSCRGVHFALSELEIARLLSFQNGRDRVSHLFEVIEEEYFDGDKQHVGETDKAWDAIHRTLTDGTLSWDAGAYPLNHVILNGELLDAGDDFIMSLKTPGEVKDIAAAVVAITQEAFRRGFDAIDSTDFGFDVDDEEFDYTWHWFENLRDFYQRAATSGRYVLFTVDQ